MLKLLIVAGSALIITVVLMARHDQLNSTQGKGYEITCTQHSQPSPPSETLICEAEHSQKAKGGQTEPSWWHVFFTFPEGVTAILLLFTLFAITWQSYETKKSSNAAIAQIRASISKDRAEIKVEPEGMTVDIHGSEFWFLKSNLKIRNVGIGSAYVMGGSAKMDLRFHREKPRLQRQGGNNMIIVDGIIAPSTPRDSPHPETVVYFVKSMTVDEQAEMIFPGTVVPYISGFIEYKTVGAIFRQNFHYSWQSRGRDRERFNVFRALSSLYPNTPPAGQEKISSGTWLKEADGNEEYEVTPKTEPPVWWVKTVDFLARLKKEAE